MVGENVYFFTFIVDRLTVPIDYFSVKGLCPERQETLDGEVPRQRDLLREWILSKQDPPQRMGTLGYEVCRCHPEVWNRYLQFSP